MVNPNIELFVQIIYFEMVDGNANETIAPISQLRLLELIKTHQH